MQPLAVVSSNAGQVLWSGIADDDKAQATADRLFQKDMFSGWGVRTLSARSNAIARSRITSAASGRTTTRSFSAACGEPAGMRGLQIFQAMLEAARYFAQLPASGALLWLRPRAVSPAGALSGRVSSSGVGHGLRAVHAGAITRPLAGWLREPADRGPAHAAGDDAVGRLSNSCRSGAGGAT